MPKNRENQPALLRPPAPRAHLGTQTGTPQGGRKLLYLKDRGTRYDPQPGTHQAGNTGHGLEPDGRRIPRGVPSWRQPQDSGARRKTWRPEEAALRHGCARRERAVGMAKPRKPKTPPGVTIDGEGIHLPEFVYPSPDDVSEQGLEDWRARAERAFKQEYMGKYAPFMKAYDAWWSAKYPALAARRRARSHARKKRPPVNP